MSDIVISRADGVVTVTINRPERKNAITRDMWQTLYQTFMDIASSRDRAVVITGAGGDFCSGADLNGLGGGDQHSLSFMRGVNDACLALHRLPQPTIAKVRGVAIGAGLNLALGCDLVVASAEARFSQIFVQRGIGLDFGGSWVLPRLVGLRKAKELALFGDIIGADEAERIGLLSRVLPADELDAFVDAWATRLAKGAPLAQAVVKRQLEQSYETNLEQALDAEAVVQAMCIGSEDAKEGMMSFLEKRPPAFQGR